MRSYEVIAKAISYYLSARERRVLRERLIVGYQTYAAEDVAITAEWRETDDEAWLAEVLDYDITEPDDESPHSSR